MIVEAPRSTEAAHDTDDHVADRWLRVSRWGAAAIGVWSAVVQLLIGELIPPVLIIGVVFVAFVPFLRTDARRLSLVVGVLALVALVGNLAPLVDELSNPDSGWAFVPSLFVTLTALVLAVAGVGALRRWSSSPTPLLLGAGLVFGIGSLVAVLATASVESDQPLSDDTVIVATGNEFASERLVVSEGPNGFWLDNRDGIRHTFTIRATGFEIDAPGESQQRGDTVLEPGVYEVYCNVPGHENMAIELIVQEQGG